MLGFGKRGNERMPRSWSFTVMEGFMEALRDQGGDCEERKRVERWRRKCKREIDMEKQTPRGHRRRDIEWEFGIWGTGEGKDLD